MFEGRFLFLMLVYTNNIYVYGCRNPIDESSYICSSDLSLHLTVTVPCSNVLDIKMQQMQTFPFAVSGSQAHH